MEENRMPPVGHHDLVVIEYISGVCRNEPERNKSHTYAMDSAGELWPMCEYGWNRSNGMRLSILRGWGNPKLGHCKICQHRTAANLRPILEPKGHKTKWL